MTLYFQNAYFPPIVQHVWPLICIGLYRSAGYETAFLVPQVLVVQYMYICIQRNLLGIKFETHFLEIISKEATLKTNMVEPAWAVYNIII